MQDSILHRNTLYHPVSIGNLRVSGNLFLAPVAGFSDAAFRSVCLSRGAVLAFTEMVSCEGIVRNNKKTIDLLKPARGETKTAVQLFCARPETAAEAVLRILDHSPAVVDLNCGCPVPKVVKSGAGSALMKEPSKIGAIVRAIRTALDRRGAEQIPVTVKLRSGWDGLALTYLDAANAAVRAGAAMITLHPRTRAQGYSGTSDWEHLKRLKESVSLPVFGSGDLFSPGAALKMLTETGCDGVMFARGAIGNPFIFDQTRTLLETGREAPPPSKGTYIETIREHLYLAIEQKGELPACREMRKHLCAYTKGVPGGASLRRQAATASTLTEYNEILEALATSY